MKRLVIAVALALAGSALHAHAQNAGGATTPGKASGESGSGGGAGRGFGGQHELPSPEKTADELMKKFDADMDGELSQDELTQALEALGEHHPHHGGGGKHGRGGARAHGGSGGLGGASELGASGAHADSGAAGGSGGHGGSGGAGGSGTQGASDLLDNSAQGANQDRPSADQIATQLIEKYSSDKKGLKQDELAKAIKEHRANRGRSGGQQTGSQPASPATP